MSFYPAYEIESILFIGMQDLNYQIFLLEPNGNYAEVDAQDVNFNTVFALSEIKDISTKKDTISKNITLKGTKNNNRIFGNVFNQSRHVDSAIEENLFVNFSVNKQVECIVLENSISILKGYLVFDSATKAKGVITYTCHIVGSIFNVFGILGDKKLEDLDFAEYTHQYEVGNITETWDSLIYLSGSTVPFAMGKGYLYPFINYGDKTSPYPSQVNQIHINNFRPAVYHQTYLDKIFAQPDLSGFTYEIKGSTDFQNELKTLVVPDNESTFNQTASGTTWVSFIESGRTIDKTHSLVAGGEMYKAIDFNTAGDILAFLTPNTTNFFGVTKNLFTWKRDVNTDISISLNFTVTNNNSNAIDCYIRFIERDAVDPADTANYNLFSNFQTVTEFYVGNVAGHGSLTKSIAFVVPQRTFTQGVENTLILYTNGSGVDYTTNFPFGITDAVVNAPSNPGNVVTYSVVSGDMVKPMPPIKVTQKEFIKSFILMFNLYTYSSLLNPKHIIFQSYNDYYSTTRPENIGSTALDWSKKLDYSQDFTISSYGEIAKKYSFAYKSDTDYYNTLYSNTYKEVYGSFSEVDTLGNADEKMIELVYSPTPIVNNANTGRNIPEIFTLSSNKQTTTNSNIRILYYNGLKACNGYQVGTMQVSGSAYTFTAEVPIPLAPDYRFDYYPQVSHLKLSPGLTGSTYLADLNWGLAGQYYFPATASIYDTPNLYSRFYDAQIKELTDLNNVLFQANCLLSEVDISNLDMRNPIFIDTPDGNTYLKILEVDYSNRLDTSTVKFQKVNL